MSPVARRRPQLPILPAPRRLATAHGAFRLADDVPIVVMPGTAEAHLAAGTLDATTARLAEGLRSLCGASLPVEAHTRVDGLGPHVRLAVDARVSSEPRHALRGDGYRLEIGDDHIAITGAGPAGLRYGVETLLQQAGRSGRVPAGRIDDGPDFALRGIMLDVSRGKVPTAASVETLIDLCAAMKLNLLMLYTEHTFRFRRHSGIGRGASPLDAATMRHLDAYAAARFVQLVPCLQSLGHMEHILALPEYAHLAESEMGWTICPSAEGVDGRPGTLELLRDLYDEYLPSFRSPLFNANCDEPWDLGRGRSKARSEALGPGGVYLDHVRNVRDLARRHGKRTMIWGDVVHAHPERITEIDRDLVLLDWWYEAEFAYDRVEVFARNGIDFMVCPGTSSWNSLFPRVENSQLNVSRWADAGRRHGALGLLNTDWGDLGHYNLQGNSLFAYAWGAQQGWSGASGAGDFDRAFSRLVFGDARGETARLYRALGALHDPGFAMFNGSALQYLFFDSVESAYFVKACRPGRLAALERRLVALRPRIEAARDRAVHNTLALDEMLYAADASLHAVRKGRAGLEYLAWRRRPADLRAAQRRALARRMQGLAGEQVALGRRLRRLWLARSAPSNIDLTLGRIARAARHLRAAARRLERGRATPPPEREPLDQRKAMAYVRESIA